MDWTVFLIAFSLAILAGALATTTLARMRPDWTVRRRILTASAILPLVTLVMTGAGIALILFSDPRGGEDMRDLAAASLARIGATFAVLAFVGGVLGAGLRQRRMGR